MILFADTKSKTMLNINQLRHLRCKNVTKTSRFIQIELCYCTIS
jgi:hypothetical protein